MTNIFGACVIASKKTGIDSKELFALATKGGCETDEQRKAVRMVHGIMRSRNVAVETEQA